MRFLSRFGRRSLVILGGTIGVLGLVAGIAVASIPDASGVIHACYKSAQGQVRIVEAAADCNPSESAIQWSQTGPSGPAGPAWTTRSSGAARSNRGDWGDRACWTSRTGRARWAGWAGRPDRCNRGDRAGWTGRTRWTGWTNRGNRPTRWLESGDQPGRTGESE